MKEEYLHFIWKYKRLPWNLIKTTEGEDIEILHQGVQNEYENGPDFYAGKVRINGILWSGNIEIHIKSSDWYKHKHHIDPNYDNVILHVVLINDRTVEIKGCEIPTIELKSLLDWDHFRKFEVFKSNISTIVCAKQFQSVDRIFVEQLMQRAFLLRMNRKIRPLYDREIKQKGEALYFLLARAFGQKVNQLPFEELTNRLPFSVIAQLSSVKRKNAILYFSGLDDSAPTKKIDNNRINAHAWKKSGMRPQSQPHIRLLQFATLLSYWDLDLTFIKRDIEGIEFYFSALFSKINTKVNYPISETFKNGIIINAIVPFLWWLSEKEQDERYQNLAVQLLVCYQAEKNYIIRYWNDIDVRPKNSYESQALIEIFNEFCTNKRCLQCDVGVKLLKE